MEDLKLVTAAVNRLELDAAVAAEAVAVGTILAATCTADGCVAWLYAPSRLLDGARPIDLLAVGQGEIVRRAAWSFVEGAAV